MIQNFKIILQSDAVENIVVSALTADGAAVAEIEDNSQKVADLETELGE